MLLFLPPFHSQTLYLSFWQGVMPQRLTFPGLMRKVQFLSYTPTVSSACSFWQVLAPTPHLSAWYSPFPQPGPPALPCELPSLAQLRNTWELGCHL